MRRIAVPLAAMIWLAVAPGSAMAGYDIAHIVERTCEPGGSLIVTDKYKLPRDRGRVLTEPGEVIDCPPAGPKDSFQIAAGPENIGGGPYLCAYFSLFNGDGADTCLSPELTGSREPFVEPLMAVRPGKSGPLELAGIASDDVRAVDVSPAASLEQGQTVTPIDAERATRLGAAGAFGFFSLTIDADALCADDPPRVMGLDRSRKSIVETAVLVSTRLLSGDDGVPFARSLKSLCRSEVSEDPVAIGWTTRLSAMLRSLFGALI